MATVPPQAAPLYVYVLVRDEALDLVEVTLGGELPVVATPDFATWQPVLAPMIQSVLTLAAAASHEDGSEVDFSTEAGDFASVWIEDVASDGGYADPTRSQWAADLLNAQPTPSEG